MNKEKKRKAIVYSCNVGTVLCLGFCLVAGVGIYHNVHTKDQIKNEIRTGKIWSPKKVHRINDESKGMFFGISSTPHSRKVFKETTKMNDAKANDIRKYIIGNNASVKAQQRAFNILQNESSKSVLKGYHFDAIQTSINSNGSAKSIANLGKQKISKLIKSHKVDNSNITSYGCAVNHHGSHVRIVYVLGLHEHSIQR